MPEGPTRRWIAASLLFGVFEPRAATGDRLRLGYHGDQVVAEWGHRTIRLDSADDRESLIQELRTAPQPLLVEPDAIQFAHVAMLASLLEHGIAFHMAAEATPSP